MQRRERKKNLREETMNSLWSVLGGMRGALPTSDYSVVLFFLSLHKDFTLKEVINSQEDTKYALQELVLTIEDEDLKEVYYHIYSEFEKVIRQIPNGTLIEIFRIIDEIDQLHFKQDFGNLFDEFLYRIFKFQGRYGGEAILPQEVSKFINSIFDLPENVKIYNPFAGLGSFAISLNRAYYLGQEINYRTWILGILRLRAYDRLKESRYMRQDSILTWPSDSEKFDLIVSCPPFNLKLGSNYKNIAPDVRTAEQFLIKKGIDSLTENGRLVVAVPHGFLFRGSIDHDLRRRIVEEDLIESIISLPAGLLSSTGIPFVILTLNKAKKNKSTIKIIDASENFIVLENRERILDYNSIREIYQQEMESSALRMVSTEEVRNSDYNLNVPRYFHKDYTGVELSSIARPFRGSRPEQPNTQGKFVRVKDLKDDLADYTLDLEAVSQVNVDSQCQEVNQSCILLCLRYKNLKPTLFRYRNTSIYINNDIIALKVDESKVNAAFLINELHAQYVKEQVESLRMGSTIPFIRKEDLLGIKIKLIPIKQQNAKVEGLEELSHKIELLQAERNSLAHGRELEQYDSFSSLKHSLGKPLLSIGSSLRIIEKALTKVEPDWQKTRLSKRSEITLKDSFNSIHSNLSLVHSLLKNNDREFNVRNYTLKEFDFLNFIRTYEKKVQSSEASNISVTFDIHPDLENRSDEITLEESKDITSNQELIIEGNEELLEIALNNLVENANRHAFIDSNKNYKLLIKASLKLTENEKAYLPFLKLEVANTGERFTENFSLEKFIRKNSSAGPRGNTGIGGHDINEIVKIHNGGKSTLELVIGDSTSEYVTTFSFLLPINN